MKKRIAIVLAIITVIGLGYGIYLGAIFLKLAIPSERELWKITGYDVSDAIVVNDVLLFKGYHLDAPAGCGDYIYAVDKTMGKMMWSTEELEEEHCKQAESDPYLDPHIISTSETDNIIIFSLDYWSRDDDARVYVIYALSSIDGQVLWEAEGYAIYYNYNTLEYPDSELETIYIVNKAGSIFAIDSRTGRRIWEKRIAEVDDYDDIMIEYYDQVIYVHVSPEIPVREEEMWGRCPDICQGVCPHETPTSYTPPQQTLENHYCPGNGSLIAFSAINGERIWETSIPNTVYNFVQWIIGSDQLVYLVISSKSLGNPPHYITAFDNRTGKQVWELSITQGDSISTRIFGSEIFIITRHGEEWGDDYHELNMLIVVNNNTGEALWRFNENYPHGELGYLYEDDVVYVFTEDSFIFALDSKTGKTIWQAKTSGRVLDLLVEGDTLIAAYKEKYVAAFYTKTGTQKWVLNVGMDDSWSWFDYLMTDDGVLYVASPLHKKVYAIDIEKGKELWSWNHNHPRDRQYFLLAIDDHVLYVNQYRRFLGLGWFFALKTKP